MFSVRSLLLLLLAFVASTQVRACCSANLCAILESLPRRSIQAALSHCCTLRLPQAFMLQTASHIAMHSAAVSPTAFNPCMACRTNLKKEKRVRNRVNAFRFKKGGFVSKRRFNGPDYAAQQKKADEDNQFYSMVRVDRTRRTSCVWPPAYGRGWCAHLLCGSFARFVWPQVYTYSAEADAIAAEEAKKNPQPAEAAK